MEIKAAWQVGSEGRIDGLFEDVIQHRYRLRWNRLSVGGWGAVSRRVSWLLIPLLTEPKVWGEYYSKESVNNKITDAVTPLIRYMALAMSQTTRLVRPCCGINKWRIVRNNTSYQLEMHWPVPTLRIVNTERHKKTFYITILNTVLKSNTIDNLLNCNKDIILCM